VNNKLHIEIRDTLDDLSAVQWNALCTDGNPFVRYEFLHTLQATGCLGDTTGWHPRYFLLWQAEDEKDDGGELVGAVPAYVKTHSYGEFVFDWSWAEAYQRHQLDYYPKLVSSIPFTPATGPRCLVRADQPFAQSVKLLAGALRKFTDSQEYSSAHFLFLTKAESDVLHASGNTQSGYMRRIDCQYHWHNDNYKDFNDFLAQCTSKRRKTIRRERRYVSDAGLRLEQRHGQTLSEQEWQWVHDFYQSTFDRKWGNPSLTLGFFQQIGKLLHDQVLIVFAYDPAERDPDWPVACSIMFIGDTTLYGRFWGCRAQYNALHFEACYYQGIDYCIANNIANFEPGAQGEHKITRGFVPTITRSAHYISHPGFRDAIADYLSHETTHVEQRCAGLADLLPFKHESLSVP